jgi:lactate dehydrogenase-like 2-hydroxyacid dehydrogenase
MTIYFASRKDTTSTTLPGYLPFNDLLRQSTTLFLCLPLSPSTTNLLSTPEFSLMRPDALLINVARGGIVDEGALVKALEAGKIGGAATDVFLEEPAGVENSVLVKKAREWKDWGKIGGKDGKKGREMNGKLVLSPHIAWWARSSIEKLRGTVASNIENWAKGEPKNIVV